MSTDALPQWVTALPSWVSDGEVRWLSRRPWLTAFIREGDFSLRPAEERFERSQRRLRATLRAQGRSTADAGLLAARGHETTAFRFAPASVGITRSVSVDSTNGRTVQGVAVPYGELSHLVQVRDILCYESFDRSSFEYLPTSCSLREAHDYTLPPVGRVTSLRHHSEQGVLIEADIDERDRLTWLRRWLRGEYSSLSIAFGGDPIHDLWATWQDHPLRTVRRAELLDVSLVRDPAYPTARITKVLAP